MQALIQTLTPIVVTTIMMIAVKLGCESFYLKAFAQKMGHNFAQSNTSINGIRATAMVIEVKELRRRRLKK